MAAFRAFVDYEFGTLEHLSAFSKVDDEAAIRICAD
jgi:hypothetical protein